MSKFWLQHCGAELWVSPDIFGNYDVPYREERSWSKQCNVPNHINSNQLVHREKNQHYMEKEKKEALHSNEDECYRCQELDG